MANGAADGSIIIDTGLDNSGFDRGSKKMEQSIKGVTQAINNTGRAATAGMQPLFSAFERAGKAMNTAAQAAEVFDSKLSGAVSSSDFGKSMTSAGRSCSSLEKQLQRLSESERMGIKTDAQMTRFQINVEKARDSVTQLEQELQKIGGQRVATPEYEELAASAQRAEQALFRLYERRDVMSALGVKNTSREWKRLDIQIKDAEYNLKSYEESMQSMQGNGTAFTTGANTSEYQQVQSALQGMMGELAHYEQMASQFDTISGPAARSQAALEGVDRELQQKPKDSGEASGAMRSFGGALKSAASTALKTAGSLAKLSFQALANGAKKAVGAIGKLGASLAKLSFKAIASSAKKAASAIGKFFSKSKEGSLTSKGLAKSLLSLKNMLVSRIKRTFISSLMNGVKESMNSLAQYSSAFNSSMSSMKNAASGLSGNIAVTFGNLVNAVAPAISTVISWISKAISYLNAFFALLSGKGTVTVAKKQTDSYADSLKSAGGAAKELKNEVYGFDELNKASSDSGGGGGGGGGASDMFEDVAIESLLPDDVQNFFTNLKTAFEAGDWEGIGVIIGNGLNLAVSAVDKWITSIEPMAVMWSERLARVFNGLVTGIDWSLVGTTIADGLNLITHTVNTFTTTFDWSALGVALGTGANSLVNGIDWSALGVLFATKFRAIWETIYGAVTTFDWANLGNSLATAANSAFQSINWTHVATAIGTGIQGIWTTIFTAINGFNWMEASTTFAEGANSLLASIDWEESARLLGESVDKIWNAIWNAISTFEWETAGSDLASSVNTLFAAEGGPIDWANAAQSMSDGLKGVIDGIKTFLEEVNWQQIGDDIATFLSNVDWNGLVTSISEGVGLALGGFAELIWELIKEPWQQVVDWWDTEMDKNGGDVIKTLLSGIVTALTGIGTWCKENIVDPLISGIETALGLEDGGIAQVATNLWEGLKNGLSTAWTTLKDAILQPFKDMWQAVKDFFGIASPSTEAASVGDFILQGLSGGLSDGVQAVLDVVADVFGRIWNAIKAIFGFGEKNEESKEAKQAGQDIMTGMKDGITGDEETVKTAIKDAGKNALAALRTELGIPENGGASSKTKTIGENLVTGISDGITDEGVEATFTSPASSVWSAVKSALDSAFGLGGWFATGGAKNAKYAGEGVPLGIAEGISDKAVKGTFTDVADSVFTAVEDAFNTSFGLGDDSDSASETKGIGEAAVTGIVDGIDSKAAESTFTSVADGIKSAVTSAMNTALGISGGLFTSASASEFKDVGKAICQGVADGINANTSVIKTAATQAASAALTAAKNKLGIHSPSKAFAEIGGYMMQGMSNGLNAAKGGVMDTITGIADSVTKGFNGNVADVSPEISVASDTLTSGMDAVASRLSNIALTFVSIADALTAIGGFNLPSVAAGTLVPYKTRVAAESPSGGNSDPMAAFTTNFDETMSDQGDLLKEIIEILRKLHLVVDGDSLTRAITSLQRSQERSYGYGGA